MSEPVLSPLADAIGRFAFVYQPNGFAKGDTLPAAVTSWIAARRDIYFLPGELKQDTTISTTPKKEAMAGSRMVWVDIDPPQSVWNKGKNGEVAPGALAAWFAEVQAKVLVFNPQPSAIITSGRGLWVFWYLDALASPEIVENINRWLCGCLEGDTAAVNVNRVARMPGTRNSKTGQLSEVLFDAPDRVYRIADFQQVSEVAKSAAALPTGTPSKVADLGAFAKKYGLKQGVADVIAHGHDPSNPARWPSRSEAVWFVCCEMARAGVPEDEQAGILLDRANGVSASIYNSSTGKPIPNPERYARRRITDAIDEVDTGPVQITPQDGLSTSRLFRRKKHPHLVRHDELWLTYRAGGYYDELSDDTVLSELTLWLETCVQYDAEAEKLTRVIPTTRLVNEVFSMLKRMSHVPAEQQKLPCWRDEGPNPLEIVACANGLFHMPSGELLHHTPDFITRNAVPCPFDPAAMAPLWEEKLAEWFPDQDDAVSLLQEWFGLVLVSDTSYQKALMLIGPKRSGKGTIARMLTSLVGKSNVASPSISELNTRFGLEPLVGKQLAVFADGRIGHDTDLSALSENLLRIIGEDDVNVDRKGIAALTSVRLATRILIMANELPRFSDDTGVIASRFMPIVMRQTFSGKEDRSLEKKLDAEKSGILNWAIDGWRRLNARGYFELPRDSKDAIIDLEQMASPLKSWIADRCLLDPSLSTSTVELFADFKAWCSDQGRRPIAMNIFGQKLKAAASVEVERPRLNDGSRPNCYRGIGLSGGMQANEKHLEEALAEWLENRCQGRTDEYAQYRDQPCSGPNCVRLDGTSCPVRLRHLGRLL